MFLYNFVCSSFLPVFTNFFHCPGKTQPCTRHISETSLSSQSLGYGTDKTNLQQQRYIQETPKTKANKTKLTQV